MFGIIYKITNLINNKVYIGKAKDFNVRINQHIKDAENLKKDYNKILVIDKAIRKYGKDNFTYEIIKECLTEEILNQSEKDLIKTYRKILGRENLYNIANGGNGGDTFTNTSEEEKQRRIIKQKTTWNENVDKHRNIKGKNNPNYGHKWTTEMKKAASEYRKAHPSKCSEYTRKLMSESHKGDKNHMKRFEHRERQRQLMLGKNNPRYGKLGTMKGKHHSEEARRKISEKAKGRIPWNKGLRMIKEER